MRKIIPLILILCISLCACKSDGSENAKANPATDFEYSLSEQVAIKGYNGVSKNVVIPEEIEGKTVTVIFSCAFMSMNIESVVIPDTVTIIWDHAFENCKSLKVVTFGDNITEIMENAFSDCTALLDVKLPEKLEKLGTKAFSNCTNLKKAYLNKNLSQMGTETFYGCPIEELILEDGIKKFGSYAAFWGATLKKLTIPASVEEIGEYAFHDNLEEVTFSGDAPKKLGNQPFGTKATVYYKKGTDGWEDTTLREYCELIEQ